MYIFICQGLIRKILKASASLTMNNAFTEEKIPFYKESRDISQVSAREN